MSWRLFGENASTSNGSFMPQSEIRVVEIYPQTNRLNGKVRLRVTDLARLLSLVNEKSNRICLFVNGNELSDVYLLCRS